MNFGAHVSISPSLEMAPKNAADLGCECFQCFSQSPRGGGRKIPRDKIIQAFKKNLKKFKIKSFYLHAPYFINLASTNNRIFYGSINAIAKELEIASLLGANGMVTHIGSFKDFNLKSKKELKEIKKIPKQALERVVKGLNEIIKKSSNSHLLLLENSAGSGMIAGSTLDQLAYFIQKVQGKIGGICFDTAHAFESGIDIIGKEKIKILIKNMEKSIGLKQLRLIHLNDSKTPLNSNSDRHAHLGEGLIGLKTFKEIVLNKKFQNIDLTLETPSLEGIKKDLKILKDFREKS
ncbi:MAG: deoxyribonuclease IV [Candidatus Moranbacteria bacterium]|nr:deoxyribonuclease IV [Candidatus Moranbacteria bacterium]